VKEAGPRDTADDPLYPRDVVAKGSRQLSQGIGEKGKEDKKSVKS
jgi:hypothetical protein